MIFIQVLSKDVRLDSKDNLLFVYHKQININGISIANGFYSGIRLEKSAFDDYYSNFKLVVNL